jgi:serine/threonine protein kinase
MSAPWQGLAERRATLGEMQLLGAGGMGAVYLLSSYNLANAAGPFVYKEYDPKILPDVSGQGLASVIGVRERLGPQERQWLDGCTVWPLRIVEDRGAVTGIIMRLIPEDYYQQIVLPSGDPALLIRDLQSLLISRSRCKKYGYPFAEPRQRLQLCALFAYMVAFLHRRDIVFGDISPSNVLYRLMPETGLMLVDCDAIRKVGSAQVVPQGHTPDWFPPERFTKPQSVRSDRYKLGLFILRVLSPGDGASVNRDPEAARPALDARGLQLLRASLSTDLDARTDAKTWYTYLRSVLGKPN